MGISASQARLLTITARLTSNEYESQQISNAKMRLAIQSEQASNEYLAALNQRQLQFVTYDAQGTAVDKMTYGFIGQPANIVFGMMREFDIKNQWDIDVLGYKVALLCKGDVKVLWDQDTLAVPFTRNNK